MTPEEKARHQIDAMLLVSGWAVQTKDKINLSAGHGVRLGVTVIDGEAKPLVRATNVVESWTQPPFCIGLLFLLNLLVLFRWTFHQKPQCAGR